MSTQSLASFMPDDNPQQNVADSTTFSVVSTSVSTAEDKTSKQKPTSVSPKTKILTACAQDNISTKGDIDCQAQPFLTENQSQISENLSTEIQKRVHKSPKKIVKKTSSLRLSTPSKNLASSLGLDLSSSSSSGESSDDEEKSSKKAKSPKMLSAIEKQRSAKPSKKKVQLGHSTKENQVDFVFQN